MTARRVQASSNVTLLQQQCDSSRSVSRISTAAVVEAGVIIAERAQEAKRATDLIYLQQDQQVCAASLALASTYKSSDKRGMAI